MFIQIFTMGGTIDKVYFDDLSHYEIGEPQVSEALKEGKASFEFDVCEIMCRDSIHMDDTDRELLRSKIAACPNRHILVTHGTDSMAESAVALLGLSSKVIVLTGAMSPYRFKKSDASFNLGCAVGALQTLNDGVYLTMSGLVIPAGSARKNRDAGRFEMISKG
jgi:L-asparaginase